MALASPFWLLLLLIVPLLWFKFRNKHFVGHSDQRLFGQAGSSNRWLFALPTGLFSISLVLLVIALARPQEPHLDGTDIIKTRDILIAVDISASMDQQFAGTIPPPEAGDPELDKELPVLKRVPDKSGAGGNAEAKKYQRRIDAAREALTRFVRNRFIARQADRIGIMTFDTEPHWSWPLTDDLKMIYRKGLFIDEGMGGGTNFGNMIPGPIDAAAEHFDERGAAATKVMIMVTDGEDSISESTMARLQALMQERGVRLYVIGVGETLARRDADIILLARSLGGQVFRVENAADMALCFDTIDQMERSAVKIQTHVSYQDVFYRWVAAAVLVFLLGCLAEAFIVSR